MTQLAHTLENASITGPGRLWNSLTYRRFCHAVALMGVLAGVFYLLASLESAWAGEARVFALPFGAAMQFTGLAHFAIGFAFLVSSPKMRSLSARRNIGLTLLAGAGLCWLFYLAGGPNREPRLPMAILIAFFMAHQLRDEFFFYRCYRERRPIGNAGRRVLLLGLGLSLVLLAGVWTMQFLPSFTQIELRDLLVLPAVNAVPAPARMLLWGAVCGALIVAARACLRPFSRAHAGIGIRESLALDWPIWAVYASIPVVIAACLMFGGKSYSIVLLHVTAWWVFATVGLRRRGRPGGPRELGLLGWCKHTQTGFQSLHIGLTVIFVAAAWYWVYGTGAADTSPLALVADRDAFYYWTLLHVAVSFTPRPA